MATAQGSFGCGGVGLSGFFGTKEAIEMELKGYNTPLVFAVLTQTQREAIRAFEALGGYCAAQCYNHGNTVGLYVRVRSNTGSGHEVKRIKKLGSPTRKSFRKWWDRIPHHKKTGAYKMAQAAWRARGRA